LLYGRVVDMFYFPLFSFYWPDWVPFVGGDYFLFFQPIFNLADAAITVGMLSLILFYSKSLTTTHKSKVVDSNE
jgi:signal peptidase II